MSARGTLATARSALSARALYASMISAEW